MPVVRQTVCKSILNRSTLGGYSLNCYTGCTHACVYCYARFMQRFHPHQEPWGSFVDVKVNAVETLKRQLRRAEPAEVFVSSACDGWQPRGGPVAAHPPLLRAAAGTGFPRPRADQERVGAATTWSCWPGVRARVAVTLTTLDPRLERLWEPGAASVTERLQVVEAAGRLGIETGIMLAPLLPLLSDGEAAIAAMLQQAADLGVDVIWVDAMNPRPRVWPAVADLLRREFPDLLPRYRKLLFDPPTRAKYLDELRLRVERLAGRLSLADRVRVCP